jgi:hypothetical protein
MGTGLEPGVMHRKHLWCYRDAAGRCWGERWRRSLWITLDANPVERGLFQIEMHRNKIISYYFNLKQGKINLFPVILI